MSGGKGGGSAPAAPDYIALANRQGQINADAARLGTQLSRVNQVTPYGSVTYRQIPGQTPTGTPQPSTGSPTQTPSSYPSGGASPDMYGMYGYLSGQYNNGLANALSQYGQNSSSGPTYTPGNDQWEQITTLSPEQQQLFDINQSNQIGVGNAASGRLGQIANQGPLDFSGQPSQVTGVQPSQFNTNVTSPGTAYSNIDLSQLSNFGSSPVQSSLDYSGAPAIPGSNDFSAERQRVEDALYGRATSSLDPQWQQREDQARTRLINSGNTQGSEAWNTEMANLDRERQNAYTDARDSAILAGGNEQSRLMADALRARQESVGETTTAGQFANSAANQANTQAASQRAQQLSEILNQGQFGNAAANQALQAELSKLGLYNAAQGDQFAQGQANAALQNQGRATGIQELLTQRNIPLQEFMSLYGGSQPNVPNSAVGNSQSVSPYDLVGAANQNYQSQLDQYNAQQARQSGLLGGLLGLGGSLGGAAILSSDERLKENIEPIGELPQGLGVYEYEYKADPSNTRHVGVIAQEVEKVQPDAVLMGKDGYRSVNYSKVLARALRDAA